MTVKASNFKTKDPGDTLDYLCDWSDWLNVGDTVASSSWNVPTGLLLGNTTQTATTTTVWVSGGTAGQDYELTNTIVTNGGRTKVRRLYLQVELE